jgi:hypothetical protein
MQRFAAHDEPGSLGPARQVNEVGDVTHRGVGPFVTGLGDRGLPAIIVDLDARNCRVNLAVFAGHDRESDVTGPTSPHEPGRRARRIGTDHHRPGDRRRVVAGLVSRGDVGGKLTERVVEDREVIGRVVRGRVPGP